MSLLGVFDVAGSGMSAQSLRLNTISSNIANAESVSSSLNETYRSRQPVFAAMYNEAKAHSGAVGVKVAGIVESNAPIRSRYEPGHPMADEKGYIYMPNVNVVEEMANMMSASRSYQANVELVNTSKQLLLQTLRMGQ